MRTSVARQFATAVAAGLFCISTACTTLAPIAADASGAQIRAQIKTGDTVRVLTADGITRSFQVSALGESSLVGTAIKTSGADVAGSRIEVPYRDIQQIEVQRVSGLKTTAIFAVVAIVAAVAIATGGGSHTPGFTR